MALFCIYFLVSSSSYFPPGFVLFCFYDGWKHAYIVLPDLKAIMGSPSLFKLAHWLFFDGHTHSSPERLPPLPCLLLDYWKLFLNITSHLFNDRIHWGPPPVSPLPWFSVVCVFKNSSILVILWILYAHSFSQGLSLNFCVLNYHFCLIFVIPESYSAKAKWKW